MISLIVARLIQTHWPKAKMWLLELHQNYHHLRSDTIQPHRQDDNKLNG